MNLLFVQGGSRIKKDKENNYYTDGNLNNKVWNRYKEFCDKLLIILRKEEKIYPVKEAKERFNEFDLSNTKLFEVDDLMRPKTRFFSLKYRKKIKKEMEKAVIECDKAIIRSAHNFYTLNTIKYCKKHHKPYLIEVAGYAFDGYWTHGDLYGKIVALPYELLAKKAIKEAKYCVYVTNESLQKRYFCNGKTLGCSDVELNNINVENYKNKIDLLAKKRDSKAKLVLGTIGWLNLKLKGQQDVIKTLSNMRKKGFDNFEYQLIGLGDHSYLDSLIKKYHLEDCVKIIGSMPHEEVFEWLKTVDIYIQPSYTEGLCRAIVEAMSMACPIVASNAGGNIELANKKYTFKRGNKKELENILSNITIDDLITEAQRSFEVAKTYEKSILDKKREKFYKEFCKNGKI